MNQWLQKVFFISVFFIPLQRRFCKVFRGFSESLVDPSWNLPGIFEKNVALFVTDFPILVLFFGFLYLGRVKWRELLFQNDNKYLIMLVAVAFLSIAGSAHPFYALHYIRLVHFILPVLLFCFLSTRLIDTENLGRKIFQVVLAVALFECFVGITQYFRQDSLGLKLLGEQSLTSRHVSGAGFPMSDGSLWLLDRFFNIHRKAQTVIRAYGTLPHPNVFGGFLVLSLLGTFFLFQEARRKRWLICAIVLQIFTLFITYSRSALFAFALGSLAFLILAYLRKEKIGALAATVFAGSVACIVLLYPQLFERGGVVSYNPVVRSADVGRLVYQQTGTQMIKDHPLLGVGFDNYLIEMGRHPGSQGFFVHNIYVFLGAELGLIGIALFLWFILRILKKGWEGKADPVIAVSLAIFSAFLFVGFCDFYLIWHQSGRLMFFLVAGLINQSSQTKNLRRCCHHHR